ncbi:hypothetical protein 65p090 [Aeromonas phage 65]|uniref:Uncharacterized protein n=2 Tax=Ishigurovirus osborne TaxID=260149 RepID=A0A219YC01_9CAUD|nr:hypothetical protein ST65p090 [Aeromonas phage 65]ADQ53100.1 hypothetical protein 65p090 [Aeromonas phage 65]APU01477.1 hypothetical protein [Aeromonas phage 65.2]
MDRNWREIFTSKEHMFAYINLERTQYNTKLFDIVYDTLTARNGVRVIVINEETARNTLTHIYRKLGYKVSGDKYIIGNSVVRFSDKYDVPRGMFYKHIIQGD